MIEVKGNENIVSAQRRISSFIRLHISISGKVELIQADEEKVIVECDENLQEYIEVTNSGRTLYVTAEGKWRKAGFSSLNVKIYYRQLYNIYNASSNGELICTNTLKSSEPVEIKVYSEKSSSKLSINAPAIRLITACIGDVEIEGACSALEINAKSEGDLNARGVQAKTVTLKNYSQGNLQVSAEEWLTISNYGEGNICYYGEGRIKDIKQYGAGEIKHMID